MDTCAAGPTPTRSTRPRRAATRSIPPSSPFHLLPPPPSSSTAAGHLASTPAPPPRRALLVAVPRALLPYINRHAPEAKHLLAGSPTRPISGAPLVLKGNDAGPVAGAAIGHQAPLAPRARQGQPGRDHPPLPPRGRGGGQPGGPPPAPPPRPPAAPAKVAELRVGHVDPRALKRMPGMAPDAAAVLRSRQLWHARAASRAPARASASSRASSTRSTRRQAQGAPSPRAAAPPRPPRPHHRHPHRRRTRRPTRRRGGPRAAAPAPPPRPRRRRARRRRARERRRGPRRRRPRAPTGRRPWTWTPRARRRWRRPGLGRGSSAGAGAGTPGRAPGGAALLMLPIFSEHSLVNYAFLKTFYLRRWPRPTPAQGRHPAPLLQIFPQQSIRRRTRSTRSSCSSTAARASFAKAEASCCARHHRRGHQHPAGRRPAACVPRVAPHRAAQARDAAHRARARPARRAPQGAHRLRGTTSSRTTRQAVRVVNVCRFIQVSTRRPRSSCRCTWPCCAPQPDARARQAGARHPQPRAAKACRRATTAPDLDWRTKKIIVEEGHSLPRSSTSGSSSCATRRSSTELGAVRAADGQLAQPHRLSPSLLENRRLAVELAALIIAWEHQRVAPRQQEGGRRRRRGRGSRAGPRGGGGGGGGGREARRRTARLPRRREARPRRSRPRWARTPPPPRRAGGRGRRRARRRRRRRRRQWRRRRRARGAAPAAAAGAAPAAAPADASACRRRRLRARCDEEFKPSAAIVEVLINP